MKRTVTGPEGTLGVNLLIIGIISIILTVLGSLLVRELHRWIPGKKLRLAAFTVTLIVIWIALVYFGDKIFGKPEIGVLPTMLAAVAISEAYEDGKEFGLSGWLSGKADQFSADKDSIKNCWFWVCFAGVGLFLLSYAPYFVGLGFSVSISSWMICSYSCIALIAIYGEKRFWSGEAKHNEPGVSKIVGKAIKPSIYFWLAIFHRLAGIRWPG